MRPPAPPPALWLEFSPHAEGAGIDFIGVGTRFSGHIGGMPLLEDCKAILRRLMAEGDEKRLPLAQRAINEYLDGTPPKARISGLRLLQEDVIGLRNAIAGNRRAFAEAVSDYIAEKLRQ